MHNRCSAEIEFTGLVLSISRNAIGEIERLIINVPYENKNRIYSRLIDCRYTDERFFDKDETIRCGNIVHGSGYLDILVDGWFVLTGKANLDNVLYNNDNIKYKCDQYFGKNEIKEFLDLLEREAHYVTDRGDNYGPGCNETLNIEDILSRNNIYRYIYEFVIIKKV